MWDVIAVEPKIFRPVGLCLILVFVLSISIEANFFYPSIYHFLNLFIEFCFRINIGCLEKKSYYLL